MSRVGFKPTTPVFKRAKTVHASDRAATVIANIALPVMYVGVLISLWLFPFSYLQHNQKHFSWMG
jgi:hypothetical protein